MSVDFDRLTHGRRGRSAIDNFLDENVVATEAKAEALAERTIDNYQAFRVFNPMPVDQPRGTKEFLTFATATTRNLHFSLDNVWREAALLASDVDGKGAWDTIELRRLRNRLAHSQDVAVATFSESAISESEPTNIITDRSIRVVSLARIHAVMWVALVLFALFWGVAAGAAFFAGAGFSPSVATFGVLGTVALSATLFALSIQDEHRKYGR